MNLRDYQSEDVGKIFDEWKEHRSTLYVAATGLGKTRVMTEIAKMVQPKRTLLLAHRDELITQAFKAFERIGIHCEIEKAELQASTSLFHRSPVVLASVQTLLSGDDEYRRMQKFDPNDFGLLLYDECLPAGTLVDGKPIEQIKVGDMVRSFRGGSIRYQPVLHTMKSEPHFMAEVKFANGDSMACTGAHPFYTQRGWIEAALLTSCDMVLKLRHDKPMQELREASRNYNRVSSSTDSGEKGNSLLARMRQGIQETHIGRNDGSNQSQICVSENAKEQSDEAGRSQGQGFNNIASNGVEADCSGRQWKAASDTTTSVGICVGMGYGSSREDRVLARIERAAVMLQVGHCESGFESRYRGRWILTQGNPKAERRCDEGGIFEWVRVDSVEIHKRGSGAGFERLCPEGCVYNLEVAEHHCYFAEGYLVHNSHHSVSTGNRRIVEYFQRNPNLKVLGVTATPDRADEEALGQIFESVAAERDILWAIQNGWLVDIEQLFVPIRGLDFSHVRTTAGDLNGADLAAIMESESSIQGVVQPTLECAFRLPPSTLAGVPVDDWHEFLMDADEKRTLPRRRFIVFTASVVQAEMLHNIFNRVVPQLTGWVCGKTPDDQRSQLLSDFARGNIHGVCNCGVLTEGFDNPTVDLIVMARPTKSRSLYAQMVGRATRALPGIVDAWPTPEQRIDAIRNSDKPNAMVLDFVGNSGRHKLITCCDILGGNVSDEAVERAIAKAKSSSVPVEVTKELEEAEEELRKAAEKRRLEEEARKRKVTLVAKSSFTVKRVNPFDAFDIHPTKSRGWDAGKQLSEKQRSLLQRQGVDPDSAPYPHMRQLLSEMFRRWNQKLATMKQCQLLKKHGYDTKNMSMEQASKLITAIANNGWKRPDALPF